MIIVVVVDMLLLVDMVVVVVKEVREAFTMCLRLLQFEASTI